MEGIFWTYLFVILIVNAGFSAIVAYVAKQKGRNTSAFFWLSFFLSFLVGILVVLAIPSQDKQTPISIDSNFTKNAAGENLAKCPYCAEWIKAEAKVCKHCGKEVSSELENLKNKEIEAHAAAVEQKLKAEKAKQQDIELEELRLAQERKEKSKKFWSNKPLVVFTIAIGLASVVALALWITFGVSQNQTKQEEQPFSQAERKAAFEDWPSAIEICSQTSGKDVDLGDVELSEEQNEITVFDISGRNSEFSLCLVELLVPKLTKQFSNGSIDEGGITVSSNGSNVTVSIENSEKYLGASQLWIGKW